MSYDKGNLTRKRIIESGARVVMAKGYAATTMADLTRAANASGGKLTHHFPTKMSLFEAIFESLLSDFTSGPLARLADRARPPQERVSGFLDSMYRLYAMQHDVVGCPLGHAAADSDGVSPAMREQALKILQKTARLFENAFCDLGQTPALARANTHVFVSSWQGAVVIARSGEGLKYVGRVFRSLKEIVKLSQ